MEGRAQSKGRGKKRKARNQDLTSDSEEIQKENDPNRERKETGKNTKIEDSSRKQDDSSSDKHEKVNVQPPETLKEEEVQAVVIQNQEQHETEACHDVLVQCSDETKQQDVSDAKFSTSNSNSVSDKFHSTDDQKLGAESDNYLKLDEICCKISVSGTKENVTPVEECLTTRRMEVIQGPPTICEDNNITLMTNILTSDLQPACTASVVPPPPSEGMSEQLNLCLDDVNFVICEPPSDLIGNMKSSKHTDGNNDPVSNTTIPQAERVFDNPSAVEQELKQIEVSHVSEQIHEKGSAVGMPEVTSHFGPSMESGCKRECFSLADDNQTPLGGYSVVGNTDKATTIPGNIDQFSQAYISGNANTTGKSNLELGNKCLEEAHQIVQESLQKEQEMNIAKNHEMLKFPGETSDETEMPKVEPDVDEKDIDKQQNKSPSAVKEQEAIALPQVKVTKTDPVHVDMVEELTKSYEGGVNKTVSNNDVDTDMDITDSQLCEAVNAEESSNHVSALQEVQKRHLEGRKIIHDLIVDLSYLNNCMEVLYQAIIANKLLLRTKRDIETARRKRLPAPGPAKVKHNGHGFDQRRF